MRRIPVILSALLALVAGPEPGYAISGEKGLAGPIVATVVRVVDGDTLIVRAHIWIGQEVETNVRLAGVDAPEMHGRCDEEKTRARDARNFTERITSAGAVLLTDIRPDKYGGRVDAKVHTAEGADVAAALIRAGLARAYDGGERGGWCGP